MHLNCTHTNSETLLLMRSSPTSLRPVTSSNLSHGSPPPSLQIKFYPQPILSLGRSMFWSCKPKLLPMSPTVYCPMATSTAPTGLPTTLPTDHFPPPTGIKHGALDFQFRGVESLPHSCSLCTAPTMLTRPATKCKGVTRWATRFMTTLSTSNYCTCTLCQ